MVSMAYVFVWLLLAVWATWFVPRRVSSRRTRIVCYLLIWLIPLFGAASVVLIMGFGDKLKPADSNDRMLDAIVDEHRKTQD